MAPNKTWLLVTSAVLMTCFLFRQGEGHQYTGKVKPNLLFIMMDDLGWNDFGVTNMYTPTLDKMYNEAFRLNYSYADPVGSSSRAAFFSGKFSFRMGLQDLAINKFSSAHVPLNHTLLPHDLRIQGYETHLIGKWDQGFCNLDQTPTHRGFDTFFGQYTSKTNHFTMTTEEGFYDMRDNDDVLTDPLFTGLYNTDAFGKRVIKIINRHKRKYPENKHPFFTLASFTAIQAPNEVPAKYVRKCRKGKFRTDERKQKCGMMAAVDTALFRILRALEKTELDHNTLVFFTSDNGGDTEQGSSN